ncbi:hypothetical protein H0H92_008121 [Tricholoma furcatifolium]|nr:hypothetical protein H0H92_008121 [Tricholoma furcatifolium]
MAIFEHLSIFDEEYLAHRLDDIDTEYEPHEFLENAFDLANSRHPPFRRFLRVFERTLKSNVVCSLVVEKMLATSLLFDAIHVFFSEVRKIETLTEFRSWGPLIRRVVDLVSILHWHQEGPLQELIIDPPIAVDDSPGLRRLVLQHDSVWEGTIAREQPSLLENMQNFWRDLEAKFPESELRSAASEFDASLYALASSLMSRRTGGPDTHWA